MGNDIAKTLLMAKIIGSSGGGGSKNAKFVKEFQASDWTLGDTLTVLASEHGRGATPFVDVWRANNSSYEKNEGYPSNGWTLTADASGNLTLATSAGEAFAGRIVIL